MTVSLSRRFLGIFIVAGPCILVGLCALPGCGKKENPPSETARTNPSSASGTTTAASKPVETPAKTPSDPAPKAGETQESDASPIAGNPLIGRWVIDADLIRASDAFRRSPPEMQEALIEAATKSPVELLFTADTVTMTMDEKGEPARYEIIARGRNAVRIVSLSDDGERNEAECVIDGDLLHMRSGVGEEITLRRVREE